MVTVHLAFFVLTAFVTIVLLAVALAGAIHGHVSRLWLDRLILADLGALLLVTLVGPLLLLTGHHPGDVLHFLYAVLAWLALPVGRYIARAGSPRRRATVMAVAAALLLGFLLRLYMTGPA